MTLEICFVFKSLSVANPINGVIEMAYIVNYLPSPESEPPELLDTPVRFVTSLHFARAPMRVSAVGLVESKFHSQ